jgi:glycosyltransferase involved in cell wall biosynthesis
VAADARAWCRTNSLALGQTALVPLGADLPVAPGALPPGLVPGHYALLVSTIEPRKGHRIVLDAWRGLLDACIPQRAGFRLVFAGRVGWMVDDLMRDLREDPRVAESVMTITDAGDATLAALYRDAAFCLYPSRYEGFGLPVIEAFQYGKAVLASTGGAVPETVGGLSPCLDPDDVAEWRTMLGRFIADPSARAPYEARIRAEFRHPGWDEAAARVFAVVRDATSAAGTPQGGR